MPGERLSALWSAIGRQDFRGSRAQVHAIDRQPRRRAANIARAGAKHVATSLTIKKGVNAPRVIGNCLVRGHVRRKSGSPQRVAMRGPLVPLCRAMTIQISEPALIVRRAERRGLRWPLIRRTASQRNRRAPRQARLQAGFQGQAPKFCPRLHHCSPCRGRARRTRLWRPISAQTSILGRVGKRC